MKVAKIIVWLVLGAAMGVIAGGSAGYFYAKQKFSVAKVDETAKESKKSKVVKLGLEDKSDVNALRARIAELEKNKASATESGYQEIALERSQETDRPGQRNQENFLANLKAENPERYTQITNNMARWRAHRVSRAQSHLDFLASVDTSKMSKAALDTHEKLQDLIVEREDIQSSLDSMMSEGGAVSPEERTQLFDRWRNVNHEIHNLSGQERENLIKQTAEAIGYKGEEVAEIAATINKIIDATSNDFGAMHGMGWGRGPGRGGRGERR